MSATAGTSSSPTRRSVSSRRASGVADPGDLGQQLDPLTGAHRARARDRPDHGEDGASGHDQHAVHVIARGHVLIPQAAGQREGHGARGHDGGPLPRLDQRDAENRQQDDGGSDHGPPRRRVDDGQDDFEGQRQQHPSADEPCQPAPHRTVRSREHHLDTPDATNRLMLNPRARSGAA